MRDVGGVRGQRHELAQARVLYDWDDALIEYEWFERRDPIWTRTAASLREGVGATNSERQPLAD